VGKTKLKHENINKWNSLIPKRNNVPYYLKNIKVFILHLSDNRKFEKYLKKYLEIY